MRKKIIIFFLTISAVFLFFPFLPAQGQCPETGLVPCGTPGCPCTLCHFFELIHRVVNFILGKIIPFLAILMIVIGGFMYILSGVLGVEQMRSQANALFKSVVIGLILVYGAYIIINAFLNVIGIAEWTGLKTWWKINCN